MQPVIFHLIGTPAAGKYTIGKIVAERSGARFIDNHSINNVIFNTIERDGVTPLPPEIWPRIGKVREAVLDAILNVAPPGLSYVFTNYLRGQNAEEMAAFEEMARLAEARASVFIPVLLRCETAELMNRAANDSRIERMKLIDPLLIARMNDEFPRFETDHPNTLVVDTTSRAPEESAALILEWAASRAGGQS